MTAQILHFRDYKSKAEREMELAQAEQSKFEHEVLQVAFEGGPTIEIPMSEVDAHFAGYERFLKAKFEPTSIEPPADCPA